MGTVGCLSFIDLYEVSDWRAIHAANNVKGLFAGGEVPGTDSAQINFVTIASTGNSADFGDLVEACQYTSGTSDSHGGLQSA